MSSMIETVLNKEFSVAIIGATHGNECSGIAMLSPKVQESLKNSFDSIHLNFVCANPRARKQNMRFTEQDLNRQFTPEILDNDDSEDAYEATRARELNAILGPKNQSQTDLVVDIHNTTSNMGPTLIILDTDSFTLGLARFVKNSMPEANILVEDHIPYQSHPYLCTLGKRGVMIEIGPQPQGVCKALCFEQAKRMTQIILEYCHSQPAPDSLAPIEAYRLGSDIYLPKTNDSNDIEWMIHPQLQDQDFKPLHNGDPTFLSVSGHTMVWEGTTTYPHFVNEAAYKKQGLAFSTSEKTTL